MASEVLDRLTDISAMRHNGAVVELRRNALITGLVDADINIVWSALGALSLGDGSIPEGHDDLILVEANPRIVDPTKAEVELVYKRSTGEGQKLISPVTGALFPDIRTYVQQVQTNRYPSDYAPDESLRGKPFSVKHTFPDGTATYQNAEGETLPKDDDWPGVLKEQGATLTVQSVVRVATLRGIVDTDTPSAFAQIVRHVNSTNWLGGEPRTWMCTEASHQPVSIENDPHRYIFSFEWQYLPATWDADIVFIDHRVGAPPPGLVEGTGYKSIEYHPSYDFSDLFPTVAPGSGGINIPG